MADRTEACENVTVVGGAWNWARDPPYYMKRVSADLMADVNPPYHMTRVSTDLMADMNPPYYVTCVSTDLMVGVNPL